MEYPNFKVTVSCMTYNQSNYITDAMNGFTMQQTSFPFVCTIVDDASTDGEQEVIRKYVEDNFDFSEGSVAYHKETDYAHITYAQHKTNKNCYFAVLYLKENHYSKNKDKDCYLTEWREGIEYFALCEGDDFWIDKDKLQLQVDILDNNPKLSSCWGGYYIRKKGVKDIPVIVDFDDKDEVSIYGLEEWRKAWITKTLTGMYRVSAISEYNINKHKFKYCRDVHFTYYILKWGSMAYIHKPLGIYNIQEGGIYSSISNKERAFVNYNCYKELYVVEKSKVLRKKVLEAIIDLKILGAKPSTSSSLTREGIALCGSLIDYFRMFYYSLFGYVNRLKNKV